MKTQFGKTKADMSPGRWLDHIQSIWPAIASGEIREFELPNILSKEEYKDVGQYRVPMLEMAYQKAQGIATNNGLERYSVLVQADSNDKPLDFVKNICDSNGWSLCVASRSKTKHPLYQYKGEDAVVIINPTPRILPLLDLEAILSPVKTYEIQDIKIKRTLGFCKVVFVIIPCSLNGLVSAYTSEEQERESLSSRFSELFPCKITICQSQKSKTGKIVCFSEWDRNKKVYAALQAWPY